MDNRTAFLHDPYTLTPNQLLETYLIHSCLYYEFNHTCITDHQFDLLANLLAESWDEVDCEHKKLVHIQSLRKASSGYYIKKYPTIVRLACARAIEEGLARI